jgi:type II secretory pathway predicted ATPase ExeA
VSLAQLQPYYGFTRLPFTRRIAPGQLYRSRSHLEAQARIGFVIQSGALGVVTGEVGVGKTVALRAALAGLDASRHSVVYLANPAVGARGLYQEIVRRLGGEPRFHKAALIPQCQELLARERSERGKQVVIVLDEAHLLDTDQLEELRLMTLCRARDYAERPTGA